MGLCLLGLGLAPELGCGDPARPKPTSTGGSATAMDGGEAGGGSAADAGVAGQGAGGSLSPAGGEGGIAGTAGEPGIAGEPGAAGNRDLADPCQGVSAQGECATSTQARSCVVP